MNFLLSGEQIEIQDAVGRYLDENCGSEKLHQIFDSGTGHDADLWSGLCEMGVAGLVLPEEYGGVGLEMIDLAVVAEVLGRHATPGPFLGHSLAGLAILLAGNDEQKDLWLPKLASGEKTGTVALSEGSGWMPQDWAIRKWDKLVGRITQVPNADLADVIVVGIQGGGLAIVEKQAAGMTVTAEDGIDRTRHLFELALDHTPDGVMSHDPGAAQRLCDAALVLLAADAFGGASRCVDMAVEYAKVREQYGSPIGAFQGLKHQIVDMASEIEPARGLYWYAAHAWDHIQDESTRAAALAKAHLADRFLQTARNTTEAHGGIGYTWEADVQIFLKRAMFDYAFMGTPAVHRARAADLADW